MTDAPDLAAIRARVLAATWQPASTAPNQGTRVLVWGPYRGCSGTWITIASCLGRGWTGDDGEDLTDQPTEWHTLPIEDDFSEDAAALLAHIDEQAAEIARLEARVGTAELRNLTLAAAAREAALESAEWIAEIVGNDHGDQHCLTVADAIRALRTRGEVVADDRPGGFDGPQGAD